MKKPILSVLAALFMLGTATLGWAQGVGKIAGTITDSKSGDPIPGANVMVENTTRGATTDIDGEYFILNVPVGVHSVKITTIGFETRIITGVKIEADLTFELDAALNETVLEGKEVVVIAERDVVKRDVSSSVRSVGAEEITALPVSSYQDALTKTAGVVGSGTNIHIRGGRRDEILFLVDGLEVKDPQFQRRSLDVSKSAIGEMQVLTAGFGAEYGEAQSAVVNLITREGDPEYHGRVEHVMDTDGLSNYQDYDFTEASISGPEPLTSRVLPRMGVTIPGKLSLFGSGTVWSRNTNEFGTYIDTDRWYRHQVTDILASDVRKNEANTNSNLKLTYNSTSNYKLNFGWNQAQSWQNPYWYRMSRRFPDDFSLAEQAAGYHALSTIQGLSTDAGDYDHVIGSDDDSDGRADEEALNWVDDDGDGLVDEDLQAYSFNANNTLRTDVVRDQQFYVSMNQTLNPKTYHTIRINLYNAGRTLAGGNKNANEYGLASEPFVDLPNESGSFNGRYDIGEPFTDGDGDGMWDFNNPINSYPNINGFHIAGDGLAGNYQQLVPDWANFESRTLTMKWDLNSQVHQRHLLRSGIEFNDYNVTAEDRPYPSISNKGEGLYTDVYEYNPVSGALYAQDKMEYKDIIVNAGVRVDYWRITDSSIQSPVADDTTATNYVDYVPPAKGGQAYVSPRLGIAYSVTDRDVFHFNYGYFYQRGRHDYYFTGVNQLQTGGTPIIGNPDLEPAKTIAYELGVRHQFGADFLLDVSTYYKDIKNWIQTASQNLLYYQLYGFVPGRQNNAIYYNADYASIRGLEFNLSKDYGSHVSGRLTYTIAWASGKNSFDIGSDVTRNNYIEPKRETPLAWDRRHQIVANLGMNYPLRGKPFTKEWLQSGWTVNVLSQLLSGLPYTPTYANGSDITGQEYSERGPWNYQTDLNISREFRWGGLSWAALFEVRNLFDQENVLGWDRNQYTLDTYSGGNPGYINDSTSPNYGQVNDSNSPSYDPNRAVESNPDAWDIPRLIRFGLAVEF